jgi:hypothetical protein
MKKKVKRMRIPKKLLFIVVAVLLLLGAGTVAFAAGVLPFTDIAGHWAEDAIVRMFDRGIVKGGADGRFRPDDSLTRAEMATMLDRQGWCPDCHNASTELTGKAAAWGASLHGTGTIFLEDGPSASCAGCHSGGAFTTMIAAGQNPGQVTVGDPNPTPPDCRACHQIHQTNTAADWALTTTAPVALYAPALVGKTFDGGAGNLCVNCHQPRRSLPAPVEGKIAVTARFGPHHGVEGAMLLGVGGAGATVGAPMIHYSGIADTCVTCHMGADTSHIFGEPILAACVTCHAGATDFDINGVQTEVQGMLDELKAALIAKGLLDAEGAIVAGSYAEAEAVALWNYIYINAEDKSLGVHNPTYTIDLLQAGLDSLM